MHILAINAIDSHAHSSEVFISKCLTETMASDKAISMNAQSTRHRNTAGEVEHCFDESHTTTGGVRHSSAKEISSYNEIENNGSEIVNNFRTHDNTHRKLKSRHIQLIGFVVIPSKPLVHLANKFKALAAPSALLFSYRSGKASFKADLEACS